MIITFKLLFFLIIFTLMSLNSFAETKKDCSQYSTKNFASLADYLRCKKGLPPLKKSFLKDIEWSKDKKEKTYQPGKPCDEYSTKNFASLFAKLKCKREE